MLFADLGLSEPVLRAIEDAGYREPTPIQEQAIPHVLRGGDVLGCAQTGTGKTAGFTLPMIDILAEGRARARMPRSLILEPTRELAAQVAENFETYGKYNKLSKALLIGGVSFEDQLKAVDRGVDVLIATPGRLLDHFERGRLLLRGVEILVIDEADRMLDMGFIPDVERIVQLVNPKRQTLFFSATMPPEIRRLSDKFLKQPTEVTVAPPASPAETVEQSMFIVQQGDKPAALRALLRGQPVKNALIFCNRKRDVDTVYRSLRQDGFDAAALHGDMAQSFRMETLAKFKNNEITLLVCSDVAARGLDIAGLSHVFLFDVPMHAEDYVHRIGRTGRAGMRGRSLTLATPDDAKFVAGIESLIGRAIPRADVPGMDAVELSDAPRSRRRSPRGKREQTTPAREAAAPRRSRQSKRPEQSVDRPEKSAERPEKPVERPEKPADRPEKSRARPAKSSGRREQSTGDDKQGSARRTRPEREKPVVGMGDHVPAFMQRPARRDD